MCLSCSGDVGEDGAGEEGAGPCREGDRRTPVGGGDQGVASCGQEDDATDDDEEVGDHDLIVADHVREGNRCSRLVSSSAHRSVSRKARVL